MTVGYDPSQGILKRDADPEVSQEVLEALIRYAGALVGNLMDRLSGVKGNIARLQRLIAQLRASMNESNNGEVSLAPISRQFRIAEKEMATRQLLLQQAARQLEQVRIEANRQVRYMAVGFRPVAPDEPTYPRAFGNTLLAFLIFAGIYLMISLTASVLREQITS